MIFKTKENFFISKDYLSKHKTLNVFLSGNSELKFVNKCNIISGYIYSVHDIIQSYRDGATLDAIVDFYGLDCGFIDENNENYIVGRNLVVNLDTEETFVSYFFYLKAGYIIFKDRMFKFKYRTDSCKKYSLLVDDKIFGNLEYFTEYKWDISKYGIIDDDTVIITRHYDDIAIFTNKYFFIVPIKASMYFTDFDKCKIVEYDDKMFYLSSSSIKEFTLSEFVGLEQVYSDDKIINDISTDSVIKFDRVGNYFFYRDDVFELIGNKLQKTDYKYCIMFNEFFMYDNNGYMKRVGRNVFN